MIKCPCDSLWHYVGCHGNIYFPVTTNMADIEDVPPILLPCAICSRTFKPQSLEKHKIICEKSAAKKRKPFDSAKQRIQGTDLAEFLPKQGKRRVHHEDRSSKPKTSWKQTHDEFLRAIRVARGDVDDAPTTRYTTSVAPTAAPTRANEKGTCPTCNRQFGIKAYERHVAWCKERATRLPVSPATNIAKERLEARINYRAPALRNRRLTNREKYSPGSAINVFTAGKMSPPGPKPKESASAPICSKANDSLGKLKPAVVRRLTQNRGEPSSIPGPMKSRLSDRDNRNELSFRVVHRSYSRSPPNFNLMLRRRIGANDDYDPFLAAERQMNELFAADTSDQFLTESPASNGDRSPSGDTKIVSQFPLSHSSAFVQYPSASRSNKRASVIAPPSEFDDFTSDFSSDSTETNSTAQDFFINNLNAQTREVNDTGKIPTEDCTRRVVIDKSKAVSGNDVNANSCRGKTFVSSVEKSRKILEKISPKVTRPAVNRSHSVRSVRATSAPRAPERKSSLKKTVSSKSDYGVSQNTSNNNNYAALSGSNLSLSSMLSSEADIKRSNSVFDELLSSFEDDGSSFPSLKSFLKSDSVSTSMSSQVPDGRLRNGMISDEELSSPDSYKRQNHSKLSADSAYSRNLWKRSPGYRRSKGRGWIPDKLYRQSFHGGLCSGGQGSRFEGCCCQGNDAGDTGRKVITRENETDRILDRLWTAGETSCVSVHGANRLGANSLIETLVFGKAIADNIDCVMRPGERHGKLSPDIGQQSICRFDATRYAQGDIPVAVLRDEMQRTMHKYASVFRTCDILQRGCRELTRLYTCNLPNLCVQDSSLIWNTELIEALELQNMMLNCMHIIYAAENRKESRGAHARDDFKQRIDEYDYSKPLDGQKKLPIEQHWRKHTLTWAHDDGSICITYRPVIDTTLDEGEAEHVPPAIRNY
ncbi:uncharacterized protein LOC105692717 isoform X3 [Athalia rosae]|uniref:uncharacterized protein LOC105692717 isoform X3 n=1 Tax=Athalia rosae TaxID=37344 RepID=UPI0020339FB2|nr:uncharacterized protein LOC105692717 isoform X3 [Athalia rosae]